MSENTAKSHQDKSSSKPMQKRTDKQEEDVPPQVSLAIIWAMCQRLGAETFTGMEGEATVTYIKLTGVSADPDRGLMLVLPAESVGTPEKALALPAESVGNA